MTHNGARFTLPDESSARARVRKLVSAETSRRWTSIGIAHTLGFSEATLRRRLAEERVTLRELLQDVRMTHALTLLQSTDVSVLDVGLAVGYDSASPFCGPVPREVRLSAIGDSWSEARSPEVIRPCFALSVKCAVQSVKAVPCGGNRHSRLGAGGNKAMVRAGIDMQFQRHTGAGRSPVLPS